MLRVLGLSTASQYVVFGVAIMLGMVISGDRIAELIGRLLLRPRIRDLSPRTPRHRDSHGRATTGQTLNHDSTTDYDVDTTTAPQLDRGTR